MGEIDDLRQENAELRNSLLRLTDFTKQAEFNADGSLSVFPPMWWVEQFSAAMLSVVEEADAPNYLDITLEKSGIPNFHLIVVKPGRPSPHEFRQKAEEAFARISSLSSPDPDDIRAIIAEYREFGADQ